ncbi:MAG: DUF6159 family protein [Armatimonadota bacterium]|nr:DUF6159 family protein [Armatimonadota bacterium]
MGSDEKELTCPACGARIYKGDHQCLSCGARLDEGRLVGEAAEGAGRAGAAEPEMPPRQSAQPQAAPETAWPSEAEEPEEAEAPVSYDTGRRAWHPDQVAGGGGFFDALSRSWAFLRESLLMATRDKDLFLPSLFSVLANIVLLGGLALILHLTGNLQALLGDGDGEGALSVIGWVVIIGGSFVGYLVTYFFTGMTVHLVDVHLRGEDAQLGSAFADSLKNIGGIIALAIASLVVNAIASAIRGRSRRGLRDMAADAMERSWLAITYLLLPVMILEDSPFMRAVDRAQSLHRHNLLQIVIGELGLMVATQIISFVVIALGVGMALAMYLLSPALLLVGIGIAVLVFVLVAAFGAYVRTAFYTCLYLWAAAMETVGEQAPAPAPLQPAIQAGW